MASICANSDVVSVSCGTKTVITRLSDGVLFPFKHSDIGETIITEVNDDTHTNNKASSDSEEIGIGLACCDISSNGHLMAFCTLGKLLCVVDLQDSKPSIIKVCKLIRGAGKVRFTPVNNHLVVADKSGDVYLFQPQSDDNSGQLILGHLSLLLDILVTPDEQFIITCDRDEKIRVSSYPSGYNIVAFCLGHSEFVSALRLLPHDSKYLISTSGDGTIRFWNYLLGKEETVCNVSQIFGQDKGEGEEESESNIAAITDAATTSLDSSTSLICVTVDNFNACLVYKCSSENDKFCCNFIQNIPFQNSHPWGLSLSSNILWLVMSLNDIVLVQSMVFNLEVFKFQDNMTGCVAKAVEEINKQNMTADQKKNVVNLLFKRKFENVQDYLRRKELRLSATEPPNKKVKA
ncbi:tRNA (guanine-N(7)-)-methyltransferase non-catalytic subunit wuho [Macrosteles quadrilineatus]|uniref:tRNA (guanine-N(7)-)-methyltransferase non-catalytic subunit wuho n=1 Tax=Macrosteles quadrilineatus TaxID=74068 RepID=UPI0023E1C549|nr:tRNA (guanine-N(7)-)-methyltransferase non-catalytic subunit wuho [Macrosteles quadrilineatus]